MIVPVTLQPLPPGFEQVLDRDAMVRTIYGEARGETPVGEEAVAWVILNRAKEPAWWGSDVWGVCHAPAQFSAWNKSDPNEQQAVHLHPFTDEYRKILRIVEDVLAGRIADPTHGATHYKVVGTKASWDKATEGKTPTVIGHHAFYKLGPNA